MSDETSHLGGAKKFYVVEDTSQQDDMGRGPTHIAVGPNKDDTADASIWVGNGDPSVEDKHIADVIADALNVHMIVGVMPSEFLQRVTDASLDLVMLSNDTGCPARIRRLIMQVNDKLRGK